MRLGVDLRARQCAHRGRGVGRYTSNLVSHLAALAKEELWLFYLEGAEELGEEANRPGCHPAPLKLRGGLRSNSLRLTNGLLLPWRVWRLGIQAMLFPQGPGVEAVCAIPTRLSCPAVIVAHDLIPLIFPQNYPQFSDSQLYQSQYQTLSSAEVVIADSECTRTAVCSLLGVSAARVRTIYPGVDPIFSPVEELSEIERVCAGHGISPPYYLTVGGYDWRKNLCITLLAFDRVRRKTRARFQLVVVEERAACPEETLALIEELGLSQLVLFTGLISDAELRALYSGAQALVFPSFYEGFGLPVLEAMACGTPVICSRAGALPEVAWDAALYVQPQDEEGLATNMLRLSEEAELHGQLRAAGLARAEYFSWPRTAGEVLALCRQVAGVPEMVAT